MRSLRLALIAVLAPIYCAFAQIADPVRFTYETKRVSPEEIVISFTGTIDPGWHVYSTDISEGPTAASFHFDANSGIEADGPLKAIGKEKEHYDEMFETNVRYFENKVVFEQRLRITATNYEAKGYLEYGACNDQNCLPPTNIDFQLKGSDGPANAAANAEPAAPATDGTTAATEVATSENSAASADSLALWAPAIDQMEQITSSTHSLPVILLLGLLAGLLALFTPCVWPIIPMTVSFFLHRTSSRAKAIRSALLYGLSIVIIYVGIALPFSILRGPSALNALSTSAVFNIIFCLLLIVFAASFLGAFEITLPSSWSNRIDRKAESSGGFLGIFFMAFTLALVSFSCTGPIVGLLLVEASTNGNILTPILGMLGFAIGLALPFTLFALFPTWLKKMPRSGGWMNQLKVVLAFIELAFALKFLSVADLAYGWHILDREVFLSLWIVLSLLLGLYLLGKLRFPCDDERPVTSVPHFFLALAPLAFAVYMVPGLWGAPLKALSAFAPPLSTQDFNLAPSAIPSPAATTYEEGIRIAREQGKPILLDFTGYGCVNCRKMENAVWGHPSVAPMLTDRYVLVSLHVDDKTPLPQPFEVEENGKTRLLRTVGDKWSYLQRHRFGANVQPFYVPIRPDGTPLNRAYSFSEDPDAFAAYLKEALGR